MMHFRKLGRVGALDRAHRVLQAAGTRGLTTWELSRQARTVCPATVVSELRRNGVQIETCRTFIDGVRGFVYRIA